MRDGSSAALWGQFGAAIDMLDNAIVACPESLYNLRHVQHHAAQLNLILRQTIDSAPPWVGRAKLALEGE